MEKVAHNLYYLTSCKASLIRSWKQVASLFILVAIYDYDYIRPRTPHMNGTAERIRTRMCMRMRFLTRLEAIGTRTTTTSKQAPGTRLSEYVVWSSRAGEEETPHNCIISCSGALRALLRRYNRIENDKKCTNLPGEKFSYSKIHDYLNFISVHI